MFRTRNHFPLMKCPECAEPFAQKSIDQNFCSPECHRQNDMKEYRKRIRNGIPGTNDE